jgi:formate hydrogenlyase subunit 6/NADH:ubiquinone oxidoreductase subunit I
MRKPKWRELVEAIRSLFSPAYTSKYPFEPHTPPKKFRGKPVPDDELCIGCMACSEVCPPDAIIVEDDPEKGVRKILRYYDRCIFCGQCEANCTTEKGVVMTGEFDLAAFDRKDLVCEQEFELVQCEKCRAILGTKKHILWLAKKLGPLAYGNFPLILTAQKEMKFAAPPPGAAPSPKEEKPAEKTRSDLFRILCPKCRHEVLVFDQYGK